MKHKQHTVIDTIALESIQSGATLDFSLYIKEDQKYRRLVKPHTIIDEETLEEVSSKGQHELYINIEDKEEYQHYLSEHLSSLVRDKNIPKEAKCKMIYSSTSNLMEELLLNPDSPESILKAKNLVSESLDHVLTDDLAIKSMITMSSYDYYTYSHSVNVSIYAIGLGKFIGLNKEQLNLLGSAALLHDLGKSKVATQLINKKGRLTEDEFEIVKSHPEFSYELLKKYGEKSFQILSGARYHHEKFDGTGYPKGLKGEDIPLFGRIILIEPSEQSNKKSVHKKASSLSTILISNI
jgi:HD-GYP domain-containing protein (c-di-GMP phosphodiesterase class II)